MIAILLAAGQGTRLRPYTNDVPKCMVTLCNKSLIQHQIEILRSVGIDKIIVVGGYKQEKIDVEDVEFVRNEIYDTTNMVISLMRSRDYWSEDAVVAYTDIIYEKRVLDQLMSHQGDYAVVVDVEWDRQFKDRFGESYMDEAEELLLDAEGHITQIGAPLKDRQAAQAQFIGLMKYSKKALEQIAEIVDEAEASGSTNQWMRGRSIEQGYMTDLLQNLIDRGIEIDSVQIRRGWLEVDQVSDLELYRTQLEKFGKLPYFKPHNDQD